MSLSIRLLSGACCVCLIVAAAAAADETGGALTVGQVRTMAINPRDRELLQALAHQGWIRAEGQILSIQTYQALYRAIGRTWTPARVPSDEFAIPDLDRRETPDPPALEPRDPNGVLGPGDLVTGGRREPAAGSSLLHFIMQAEMRPGCTNRDRTDRMTDWVLDSGSLLHRRVSGAELCS